MTRDAVAPTGEWLRPPPTNASASCGLRYVTTTTKSGAAYTATPPGSGSHLVSKFVRDRDARIHMYCTAWPGETRLPKWGLFLQIKSFQVGAHTDRSDCTDRWRGNNKSFAHHLPGLCMQEANDLYHSTRSGGFLLFL